MSPCLKFGRRGRAPYPLLDEQQAQKELQVYKPFRWIGYLSSIVALTFGLYLLANFSWVHYTVADRWLGIWECCYGDLLQGHLTAQQIDSGLCLITVNNMDKLPRWQSAILGLLLFSLAAGLFASFLTTWGVCANSLARKVYFYHSAGEIFLVCGICSMAAMITYPAVLESSKTTPPKHEYGMGYFLGWGMPLFYFVSAFCMTLDDMIHSITNDCCLACRKKTVHKSSLSTAPV